MACRNSQTKIPNGIVMQCPARGVYLDAIPDPDTDVIEWMVCNGPPGDRSYGSSFDTRAEAEELFHELVASGEWAPIRDDYGRQPMSYRTYADFGDRNRRDEIAQHRTEDTARRAWKRLSRLYSGKQYTEEVQARHYVGHRVWVEDGAGNVVLDTARGD